MAAPRLGIFARVILPARRLSIYLKNELSECSQIAGEMTLQKSRLYLHHSYNLLMSPLHLIDADCDADHAVDSLLYDVVATGCRVVMLTDVLTDTDTAGVHPVTVHRWSSG